MTSRPEGARSGDSGEAFRLTVRRGVLARRSGHHDEPDLTLRTDRQGLLAFAANWMPAQELLETKTIQGDGDATGFLSLFH
ncbi:MAG: alkyl sulfatase C-terminal domain-containing protein [Myxococcales bacterium]